jgi:uncharacterized protein (DUF1330 family)
MKIQYALALAMLAGTGVGGAAIQTLHAQAKGHTYVVVAIRKINDADAYKKGVLDKAPAVITAAGAKYVIRSDKITALDGTPPARLILLQFDSPEKAMAWHNSMKEIDAVRMKATDSLSFIVEGAM